MASNPAFVSTIRTPAANIAAGDGTGFKTLMVAGASGSRVEAVLVTNSDPANAYMLQVAIKVGVTDYPIGEVSAPAGAGTNGSTAGVNLLGGFPALSTNSGELYLAAGAELRVRSKTTVSGANVVSLVAQGGDY